MPIIGVEIIKTIDERELQKTTKQKQTKTEKTKGNRSYSERMRAKWFCSAFKLGFLQWIRKPSLISKSNLKPSFKRTINWKKYQSDPETYTRNQYLIHLVDPIFQEGNRLFVLSFENAEGRT